MSSIVLNTSLNVSTAALCYYDTETETLREVPNEGYVFPITPYSSNIQKFYVVGELIYGNLVYIEADNTGGHPTRILIGSEYKNYDDFLDKSSNGDGIGVYHNATYKYANALPVYIEVVSEDYHEKVTTLHMSLYIESMGYNE